MPQNETIQGLGLDEYKYDFVTDAEPVFRPPVKHEAFGKLGVQELAAFAILQEWGMLSHPVYVKIRQAMVGWQPSTADGLYPGGSGGFPY